MNGCLVLSVVVLLWGRPCSAQVSPGPVPPVPLQGQCSLQGFDLNTLSGASYWQFNLATPVEWLVPVGVHPDNISSVDVYVAFCKPLPSEICPVNTNAGFCQQVTLKNETVVYYDMGNFNENYQFIPDAGQEDTIGFYVKEIGITPVHTTTCKRNVSTIINFQCDPFVHWTPPDITGKLVYAAHFIEECIYEIKLFYNGSCYSPPTVAPGSCDLDGYDIATLAREPFWHAEVTHTVCYNGTEDKTCKIAFSFCHSIPFEQDAEFSLLTCHQEGAGICQIGLSSDGNKVQEYSMGKYHTTTRFAENVEEGGFHVELFNGSQPENGTKCPQGLNSRVILVCDGNAVWPDNRDLTDFTHSVYDEHCQYTFHIAYNGACFTPLPVENNDSPSPVEWILIGLFLLAVVLYLTVGMAFQYFVKGARGADIIPHYTFWSKVGSLVVEGCRYTLDIVTCFQLKKGIRKLPTSNVQYDQI